MPVTYSDFPDAHAEIQTKRFAEIPSYVTICQSRRETTY